MSADPPGPHPEATDGDEPGDAGAAGRRKRRRRRVSLATLVAVMALATGIVTLKDEFFPKGDGRSDSGGNTRSAGPIERFEGVAGHLEQSRSLLSFLDQHDHDTVYLEVGFPDLASGPVDAPNVLTRTTKTPEGGDLIAPIEVDLMTTCPTDRPVPANPTPTDGCQGTSLVVNGRENPDAMSYFQHGVPMIKGNFDVDVTGGLSQGLSPVLLKPLTFAQATGR